MSDAPAAPSWAAELLTEPRMLVLGCPGSGKTTLAQRVRRATGRPLIHLDDEHWGPGWQRPSDEEWVRRQRELAAGPEWIIEGDYLPTVPIRAECATAALVVDTATLTCLYRVVRRAARIRAGDLSALPAAVRATAAGRVRATKDFPGLLRKILRFRRHDFWELVGTARSGSCSRLVVVVVGRFPVRRVAVVRRGLAARSWPGIVVDAATLDAAVSADTLRR